MPLDSLIMSEEIFGPLLPILTVITICHSILDCFIDLVFMSDIHSCSAQLNNLEECFDVIRSRPKPLAAYLFTQNQKLKERFAMTVSAGGIVVNDIAVHVHTLGSYQIYKQFIIISKTLSSCKHILHFAAFTSHITIRRRW